MSAFFSRLFTLFCQKLQKMRYLQCVVKFQLRKLGCASTESKRLLRKLRCASEIKKIAHFDIMLFVPTSAKF